MDDRVLGVLIMLSSLCGLTLYGYFVFFSGYWMLLIEVTAFVAVVAVLGIVAWIGYTMATTPSMDFARARARAFLVRSILNLLFFSPIKFVLLILVKDKKNCEKLKQKFIKKLNKLYLDPYLGLVKPVEDGILWKQCKISGYNATLLIKTIFIDNVYPKPNHNGIVIDVGAHIGIYSIYASAYAEKVIAIEPETSNFNYLITNIQSYENIHPLKMALGDENGKMRLFLHTPLGHSLLFPSSQFEEIFVRKLDDLIEELELSKVDLIKINAEGYELQILKGAIKTIRKFKPTLVIGVHHYENEKQEVVSYLNEFQDCGYEIYIHRRTLFAYPRYSSKNA